ncbi:MAG: hypothetical protein KC653_02470 [Candidatus Andersenbacteria bacterium]|nr:hypothetical protein [Candidatus Andersenbacteria bacterium]
MVERSAEELEFRYRHSAFKEHNWLILSATFELKEDEQLDIDARIAEYRAHRESTQPLSQPSTGCVFKNPPGNFAGKLIEQAGLKGYRVGDAMVSDVHANFIVNLGEATAEDVKAVREHVKTTVFEQFEVQLEEENILLGE